jgi:cytochrome c-type biogenesis protein CcsB
MTPTETILVLATLALYAVTFALSMAGLVTERPRLERAGRWTALAGFAVHTAALAVRWIGSGHAPIAIPYENASSGAWSIVLLTLAAPRRWSLFRAAGAGAVALALVILGWGIMQPAPVAPMSPSLRSAWLYVHVFFAMTAYGAFSVASGAALAYLWKTRRAGASVGPDTAPSPPAPLPRSAGARGDPRPPGALDDLDRAAYRYVVFGFITCAVMIASGAIWARDLWGAYWSWDPVETWSLLAWLGYAVLIHLRVTYGWRGRRFAWFALFAVAFVVIAYFGVGLVFEATQHVFTVPEAPRS